MPVLNCLILLPEPALWCLVAAVMCRCCGQAGASLVIRTFWRVMVRRKPYLASIYSGSLFGCSDDCRHGKVQIIATLAVFLPAFCCCLRVTDMAAS